MDLPSTARNGQEEENVAKNASPGNGSAFGGGSCGKLKSPTTEGSGVRVRVFLFFGADAWYTPLAEILR